MLDLLDQINNAFLGRLGTGVARTPPVVQPSCFIVPRTTYPVGLKAMNLIYPSSPGCDPCPRDRATFLLKEGASLMVVRGSVASSEQASAPLILINQKLLNWSIFKIDLHLII